MYMVVNILSPSMSCLYIQGKNMCKKSQNLTANFFIYNYIFKQIGWENKWHKIRGFTVRDLPLLVLVSYWWSEVLYINFDQWLIGVPLTNH